MVVSLTETGKSGGGADLKGQVLNLVLKVLRFYAGVHQEPDCHLAESDRFGNH